MGGYHEKFDERERERESIEPLYKVNFSKALRVALAGTLALSLSPFALLGGEDSACAQTSSDLTDTTTYKNEVVENTNWESWTYYDAEGNKTYVEPVYRLYNNVSSEHLFTTDKSEYDNLLKLTKQGKSNWIGENIEWYSLAVGRELYDENGNKTGTVTAPSGCKAVWRLYNPGLGAMCRCSHYYTSDEAEITKLCNSYGWKKEKIAFWDYGTQPIYTAYSEALGSQHHYTSDKTEWQGLDGGWDKETTKNGTIGFFGAIVHPHKWTPVYTTVHHEAVTHEEPIIQKVAVGSAVYCTVHECEINYHSCPADPQCMANTYTHTIYEERQTGSRTIVDKAAYSESIIDYYTCSCGATK